MWSFYKNIKLADELTKSARFKFENGDFKSACDDLLKANEVMRIITIKELKDE